MCHGIVAPALGGREKMLSKSMPESQRNWWGRLTLLPRDVSWIEPAVAPLVSSVWSWNLDGLSHLFVL